MLIERVNPLGANPIKWPNTLKQITDQLLSVFGHFVNLALKGLIGAFKNS